MYAKTLLFQPKKKISTVDQDFIDGRLQDLGPDHFVLREVPSKAMQIDLKQRYQSAKEMSEVLDSKSYNMVQARQDLVALFQGKHSSYGWQWSAQSKNLFWGKEHCWFLYCFASSHAGHLGIVFGKSR